MTAGAAAGTETAPRRSRLARVLALVGLASLTLLFGALGVWQVERLGWKRDLIARVDERINAPPAAAPAVTDWPFVGRGDEYRRVAVTGTFAHDRETLVQALTVRGAGFWILTPLRRPDGTTILVNRGFVPSDRRDPASRAAGQVSGPQIVTGLLRLTEPAGRFLRANEPAADRWYSRDVAAIAAARGLGSRVAPYFVDADAAPNPGGLPVGGLTVVSFPNSHLAYALTWFALALLCVGGGWLLLRDEPLRQPT